MRAGNSNQANRPENHDIPDKWLSDDGTEINKTIHRIAWELIGSCSFCITVSSDPNAEEPITCSKLAELHKSRPVSIDTCLDCGQFRKSRDLSA